MNGRHVVVVGAGMGGLAAALDLACRGVRVTVVERAQKEGGKMRQVDVGGVGIDAGPTVFTMRWIFESLFEAAGTRLDEHLTLMPATVLARHAWLDGSRLDLYADIDRSAEAIEQFADAANARGYRNFCARSAEIFSVLKASFIAGQRPSPLGLIARVGLGAMPAMLRTRPTQSLYRALTGHFSDPRLRQLFGRYATYCGSSPMLAPATLMLVAHVEQDGVWQVDGGMIEVARAMRALAEGHGAKFRFGETVATIDCERGAATGVTLAGGARLDADAIVFNGDTNALASGLLGEATMRAVRSVRARDRSLSAVTWCVRARPGGFALAHHNVFFGDDYEDEFAAVFERRGMTRKPTVYLCAQDRIGERTPTGSERMLVLVNAPPDGDRQVFGGARLDRTRELAHRVMAKCGLELAIDQSVATTPNEFHDLFPGTGGALYGRANHGAFATFARPGAVTGIAGLMVAGGSAHPGPGIPMATMSGRLAADRVARYLQL